MRHWGHHHSVLLGIIVGVTIADRIAWLLVLAGALGALVLTGVVATVRRLLGWRREHTHACTQCGAPIPAPSRALYCSPICRKLGRAREQIREERAARLESYGEVPW